MSSLFKATKKIIEKIFLTYQPKFFHLIKLAPDVIFSSLAIHINITYLMVAESCVQQSAPSRHFCLPQYCE